MSQTKPPPWRHSTAGQLFWRLFSAGLPRGEARTARISCRYFLPNKLAKLGERAGWIAVWSSSSTGLWIPAKFGTKMANAIVFISYLNKICLTLTAEAGRALACLYSEVRLYKGARTATPPQSAASHATGNISVGERKSATATHVEQWVLLFLSRLNTAAQ